MKYLLHLTLSTFVAIGLTPVIFMSWVATVSAGTTIYTDKTAWENALSGQFLIENFADDQLNTGVSFVSSESGHINPARENYQDVLASESQNEPMTTWSFSPDITAYGGNWTLGGPGGSGNSLQVYIADSSLYVDSIPNSYDGEFWGFISDTAFTSVKLIGGGGTNQQHYDLDNMVYSRYSDVPATVKFNEYFFSGNDGDTWSYVKPDNSQFTYTYESINAGPNAGRIKVGNASGGIIYESSGDVITWHEVIGESVLDPPLIFPVDITIDQETGLDLVVLKLAKLTVQAGTFDDVIVFAWLDKTFPPNTMNGTLNLNAITASAVTDVDWYAKGVGLIKRYGVDAATGDNDGTIDELLSHSVKQLPDDTDGDGGTVSLFVLALPCLLGLFRRKA